jgi:hypothetical protein
MEISQENYTFYEITNFINVKDIRSWISGFNRSDCEVYFFVGCRSLLMSQRKVGRLLHNYMNTDSRR